MLRKALLGLVASAVLTAPASAQTVDELVAELAAARGGLDKLHAVRSVRMLGHFVGPQGAEAPVTIERKRPHSTRMELTIQGTTSVQAFDGEQAWGTLPMGDPRLAPNLPLRMGPPEPLPPEMAKDLENQADIEGPLVDYKAKGHQVELVGKERLDEADVWRLRVTLRSGDVIQVLLDSASHLEVGYETKRTIRGNTIEIESRLGDYKETGGVLWPRTISAGPKGRPERQTLRFDKIEVNPELDDARFKLPAR